jgi:hypothetical protein
VFSKLVIEKQAQEMRSPVDECQKKPYLLVIPKLTKPTMKNLFYFLICITIVFSCTKAEKPMEINTTADRPKPIDTAEYALSLDSAIVYTKRFDSVARATFKGATPIKAYTIRSVDLLEAMGISKKTKVTYDYVRIYLGMDFTNTFRMVLTPVVDADLPKGIAGKDVILKGPYKRTISDTEFVVEDDSYVLDFTAPCPATCPTGSPLNN